jgi:pimeloyl-ACP methyl ester carboxylesterase
MTKFKSYQYLDYLYMSSKNIEKIEPYYIEYKKPNVLFIHGLGSSSLTWRDIPAALSEHFHSIVIDLIGFGQSAKPENEEYYTIKGFSKSIADFLKKIGIEKNKKISIIGHSLGGYIALQIAIENKDMIEKLVLFDSSGLLEGPTPLLEEYRDAAMETVEELRIKKLEEAIGKMYSDCDYMPPVVVKTFNEIIKQKGARYAFEKAFHNSTTTKIDAQGFMQIQDIPCLIIWGAKDKVIPIDYFEKFKEEDKLPKAMYEKMENVGHAPFVERTALVYEKIRTFLM